KIPAAAVGLQDADLLYRLSTQLPVQVSLTTYGQMLPDTIGDNVVAELKALGYHPKHTIRFVLFANEENGLRGALKYAAEAKAKNEQHIFALESDNGGFTPRGFTFGMSAERISKIQPWVHL